jgi:MinD-like ATPase involved in chromosome partitioning or flagellar assembly
LGTNLCLNHREIVAKLCKEFQQIKKITAIPKTAHFPNIVDELFTIGLTDVNCGAWTTETLYTALTKASRDQKHQEGGTIVTVIGTQGGLGATTLTAALGSISTNSKEKITLIDLDTEYRALSRFLRVRPLFNEYLDLLLQGNLPLREDTVAQVQFQIELSDGKLSCVPPARDCGHLVDIHHNQARLLFSILQILHLSCDLLLIDAALARGTFLQGLLRVSDTVILLTSNDPALVPATIERLGQINRSVAPSTQVLLVNVGKNTDGLPHSILRDEYERLGGLDYAEWFFHPIPYCSKARRWPGSGSTAISYGSKHYCEAMRALAVETRLQESTYSYQSIIPFNKRILEMPQKTLSYFKDVFRSRSIKHEDKIISLPPISLTGDSTTKNGNLMLEAAPNSAQKNQ